MKEYIVLTVDNNILVFDYRIVSEDEKSFINKNSFYKDYLFYTLKYFKRNINKIINTIKINTVTVNQLKIQKLITFKYAYMLIEHLQIPNLKLNFLSTIDIEDYELFLTSKYIKNIDCYFMPSTYIKKFNEKNINVNIYATNKITDRFLLAQDASIRDTLYYKKLVNIKEEYPELINDLREFLKINYKLKAIHLYVYSKDLINSILDLIKRDESRNVVVFLHQGYDKGNFIESNFEWLKELSEKCSEDYTCEFRIIYSSSYMKNNLFKQLTFNNLKLISILCVYVSVVCILLIKSYEYIEKMSVNTLNTEIINDSYAALEDEEEFDDYVPDALDDNDRVEEENLTKEEVKKKYSFDKSFKKLKKINKETVGYLVVNNTEINYPLVQHSDNSYYLKKDFYKRTTSMGWIYLDYRNDIEKLNDNSIIYGHSMLNGTMFGTLKKVLSSSWRKEEDNLIISLDTPEHKYKFKIFSAYKVDYTTDYLKTNFDNKKDKEEFIKLIKGRSSFKSNVKVKNTDKILTLSTCTGSNNKRLVVHAVLIGEDE